MSRFESWDDQVKALKAAQARAEDVSDGPAAPTPPTGDSQGRPKSAFLWLLVAVAAAAASWGTYAALSLQTPVGESAKKDQKSIVTDTPAKRRERPRTVAGALRRAYPELADSPDWVLEALAERIDREDLHVPPEATDKQIEADAGRVAFWGLQSLALPPDLETKALLEEGLQYFDAPDLLQLWVQCQACVMSFKDATSKDALFGAVTVMRELRIAPNKKQDMRRFNSLYGEKRKYDNMSHIQAIASMIESRAFKN